MKHVVLFSGGCASAYVAYMVVEECGREDTVLLHTPTRSEDKDADRFRYEVARHLKMPLTEWGDGRDIWDIIQDNHCIPNSFIPFCTRILKQEMKTAYYKYLKDIGETWIEYVGFGPDEWRRVQRAAARAEQSGSQVRFPLVEKQIANTEIKRIIRDEWKIALPAAYEHLSHNNCIPCFKAGKKTWKQYWRHYPEQFARASDAEKSCDWTVFDESLDVLAGKWAGDRITEDQIEMGAEVPCDCWAD